MTMNVLKYIGNSIFKCVQFTIDCPSHHPATGKVLILDLQVYVKDNQFVYEFYEEPVASKIAIPYRLAQSKQMNMAVLVEEGLGRLRNHS